MSMRACTNSSPFYFTGFNFKSIRIPDSTDLSFVRYFVNQSGYGISTRACKHKYFVTCSLRTATDRFKEK